MGGASGTNIHAMPGSAKVTKSTCDFPQGMVRVGAHTPTAEGPAFFGEVACPSAIHWAAGKGRGQGDSCGIDLHTLRCP